MIVTIGAVAENGIIGINGRLPWHFSTDLQHFKEVTMGHAVLFGRKTFESIGKPLEGRKIIVFTNDSNYRRKDVNIVHDVEELTFNYLNSKDILFIAGGETIFRGFLPISREAYITHIDKEFPGDTYFPLEGLNNFLACPMKEAWEDGVRLRFVKYINNNYVCNSPCVETGFSGDGR